MERVNQFQIPIELLERHREDFIVHRRWSPTDGQLFRKLKAMIFTFLWDRSDNHLQRADRNTTPKSKKHKYSQELVMGLENEKINRSGQTRLRNLRDRRKLGGRKERRDRPQRRGTKTESTSRQTSVSRNVFDYHRDNTAT